MLSKINEPVSVDFNIYPRKLYWKNREYIITKLGMHHKYKIGNNLFHVFSVSNTQAFFRLVLDAQALTWIIQEYYDEF